MQKFSVSTRLLLGAGMAAAVCWTVADMLLVGFVQPPQPETLFAPELAAGLGDDADMAALMLTASPQRLLWGVLPATFSAALYLVSVFGVWRLMRTGWAARFCCVLLFAGYALSPLGHAGFYFVGAAAQALRQSTADGTLLLSLFQQFIQILEIHWLSSVGLLALGWLLFAVQTLRGQTRAVAKKCRLQSAAGRDSDCARLRALPSRRMGGHDGRCHAESGATGVFRIGVSRRRQIDIVD